MANRREKSSAPSLKRRQERLRRAVRRRLHLENLEDRRMFASPQLISISPNNSDLLNLAGANVRNVAPRQLTLRFDDGQVIDPASINSQTIAVVRAGLDGDFGVGDEIVITPGYIGIGEAPNEVVIRFAENLPDDLYQIRIQGAGATPLENIAGEPFNNGTNRTIGFELDLGAQVIAVVPQPVDRVGNQWTQRRNQIDVYFNDDDLDPALAQNVNFYRLIFTNDSATNLDDVSFTPTSATYNAAQDKVTLTFASDLHLLSSGSGTYRLRIGTNENTPAPPTTVTPPQDPGSSFATAQSLGVLGSTGQIINGFIEPKPLNLPFPGSIQEPGHRDIPQAEAHHGDEPDPDSGITTIFYNFQEILPGGVFNFITEAQKQRAREIMEIYSHYLGVDVVETEAQGLTIATADLAVLGGVSGPGAVAGLGGGGIAVMDVGELNWNDDYGGNWFQVAMHEIGHNLGLGHTYDLPPGTIMGDQGILGFDNTGEPVFPGAHDIVHGQFLFRPDSLDIDMYRFQVTAKGLFTAETFAERLGESSSLDSALRLYREVNGVRTLIAQNDDYYSEDSFLKLQLEPGIYYIGVSSTGNTSYDPTIEDTGMGGTSEGAYQLRVNFRPDVTNSLADTTGVAFDGDLDGTPGGVYNFWFNVASPAQTIFVDKAASAGGTGSLSSPYNNIQTALSVATPGSIVRILGNGGADGNLATTHDAIPYQIGSAQNGSALADGRALEVPKDVTVMIDAGAVFKLRRGRIAVGTNSASIDRSGAALQVLGTPTSNVIFTSYDDDSFGGDTNQSPVQPAPGNWGGIIFQNDLDHAAQNFEHEQQGIFLNYVNHADIRYGGGSVSINGVEQVVRPIDMFEARPTITFNTITLSADAAMAADPNSFEETNFHAPQFQLAGAFTSDYDRVGPDIYGNRLHVTEVVNNVPVSRANSLNGLFIRIATPAGGEPKELTVPGRFDDLDIVHILKENLLIKGTPGGGQQELELPTVQIVTLTPLGGGTLQAGTYDYRITFVDANGNEGPASNPTGSLTLQGGSFGSIKLDNLPPAIGQYIARRIYRSVNGGPYELVQQINPTSSTFIDNGTTVGGALKDTVTGIRARLDARLAIDPGIVVKMDGARIEATIGSQFLAEGTAQLPVVITSIRDDRYGAGGTFDQTGTNTPNTPARGDWGGVFLGPLSSGSIDHAVFAYGGGAVRIDGTFTSYNVLEMHQAQVRVANSYFEQNANGIGGQTVNRFGDGFNTPATIFVRGSQPVILNNVIRDNAGPAISINANSLNHHFVVDMGRSTGFSDHSTNFLDNQGPLVRLNRMAGNSVNGMQIRGETLHTQGVWDDTDITHVLFDTVYIPDFHTYGGLRIESSPTESLVVKLLGANAGITATGRALDIDDRIGGSLQVVGQPGRPVIFTSLRDDSVGAGKAPDGRSQFDTNNDGNATTAAPGDWRSLRLDQFSHDRNVQVVVEHEASNAPSPGNNATPAQGQFLGGLAPAEFAGDENRRLGYEIHGFLNAPGDVDVYSFSARAGTEVWLDIDRTTSALDVVLEFIDADGNVIARSNNSEDEAAGTALPLGPALKMQKTAPFLGRDHWTTNPRDAGMRLVLPGAAGTTTTYHVRVRSNSTQLDTNLSAGLTHGAYQLQIRTREIDEVPGSTVQYADISYAINGIEVLGQPIHSPLLGEASETLAPNDTLATAVNLGNLLSTDRAALSIAGSLGKTGLFSDLLDVDFYRFEVTYDSIQRIAGVTPDSVLSTIFDIDYADRVVLGDLSLWLFDAAGRLVLSNVDSNISEDKPRANAGDDVSDLTRGSTSGNDAFIGTTILPEGTYYIAVSSDLVRPTEIANNSLLRIEPINSIVRIAEDHIGSSGGGTAAPPIVPQLLTDDSVVPWFLGDVTLYVTQERDPIAPLSTRLLTIDPFTGRVETVVNNTIDNTDTSFNRDIGDIAFRSDGNLFTFTIDLDNPSAIGVSDALSGNYLQIDTSNGTITQIGDDGIITYEVDPAGLPALNPIQSHLTVGNQRVGYGVQFNAMTFFLQPNLVERLYAIGNRGDNNINNGVALKNNILYEFDINTGAAAVTGGPTVVQGDRAPVSGSAGTNAVEHGEVYTAPVIFAADPTTVGPNGQTIFNLQDRNTFTITDRDLITLLEFDAGFDIRQNINLNTAQTVRDGNFFILEDSVFQFDTGPVLSINVPGGQLADGIVVTVQAPDGSTASFEFDNSPPGDPNANPPIPDTPQRDPNATPIVFGPGTTAVQLAGLLAAEINAAGIGGTPVVATAVGNRITFENEFTVAMNLPPNTPQTQVSLTGDSGAAPIIEVVNPAALVDGNTFTVQVGQNMQLVTFEFDNNGAVAPGNFSVPFTGVSTAAQVAANIRQAALNAFNAGVPLTSQLAGDYVVLNGQNISFGSSSNLAAIQNVVPDALISVEETFLGPAIGAAVQAVVNTATFSPFQVGSELDRINFINATEGEFHVPVWTQQANSSPGVTPGAVAIPFLAGDTPNQLAQRMGTAINAALPQTPAMATVANNIVRLDHGKATVQGPLTTFGEGPGGIITGMTQLGNTIYAVSDRGGLYTVNPSLPSINPSVTTTYIGSSADDLEGIQFSGLTRGPQNVEGGRYANTLFATDINGRLYAFNTAGELQPIFVNGATSVDTGMTNVNGLAFAELDRNLWHVTDNRGGDLGHGIEPTFDGTRLGRVEGGSSYYFGSEPLERNFNYNFNGGAHGTMVTAPFSLKGYTAADAPTLYFNYFMQGDGINDAFKVYVAGDTGEWTLLSTVNTADSGTWRQVRVSLASHVGQENVRLRFDFSTAGEMNTGDIFTTGDELRAVAARQINDGEVFVIDNVAYEFELGPTLIPSSGNSIRDGETFTITTAGGSQQFEFDNNNSLNNPGAVRVNFHTVMSAQDVARSMRLAIDGSALAVTTYLVDNRLNIKGATDVAQGAAPGFFFPNVDLQGDVGVGPFSIAVDINLEMDRIEVANAIDAVLEQSLAEQRLVVGNGSQYSDGQTFTLSDGLGNSQTFEFETGYILQVPAAGTGAGGIADGQVMKLTSGANTLVFEFDLDGQSTYVPLPGETLQVVNLLPGLTQSATATAIESAFDALPAGLQTQFGIDSVPGTGARLLGNGRVQIGGVAGMTLNLAGVPSMTSTGTPGVEVGNVAVMISPTASFTSANVAAAVRDAFNASSFDIGQIDYTARVDSFDQRRVVLGKDLPALPNLTLTVAPNVAISFEAPNDISKQHQDLLRIIGHSVVNPGPLGFEREELIDPFYQQFDVNVTLEGDVLSYPFVIPGVPSRRVGFNSPTRLQANNFEGFYLDDIIIGFAERGEMYTASTPNSEFSIDPAIIAQVQAADDEISFPYQLEIRRGQDYTNGVFMVESFDTNDRLNSSYQLYAPSGANLVDGQHFTLTDGIRSVRFEFDDLASPRTNSVQPGSIPILFRATDPDYVVAASIRNAINSAAVRAVLPSITAGLSDGNLTGTASTSNRINLNGPASLQLAGTTTGGIEIVQTTTNANVLRDTLLGPGITPVGNATLVSSPNSAGLFANGANIIGLDSGIILSTGNVNAAQGPNTSDGSSGDASLTGDPQLDATFGVVTEDTTLLEFSFMFPGGTLSFDFVFASEEYNEFANSQFNDVFAFYLSGGSLAAAENLAIIPGTNTPVSINTVNGGDPFGTGAVNPQFYNNNDLDDAGQFLQVLGYDGFTDVFTAIRPNLPAGTYTIKLAISDVGDTALDSAVFLGARSFGSEQPPTLEPPEGIPGEIVQRVGDQNLFRDQGQIILSSNRISHVQEFGIVADAGERTRPDLVPLAGDLPHAGAPRNLRTLNTERLVPGVVIQNNIIAEAGQGGIHISGDPNAGAPTQLGAVPFARVVNNTIYGGGVGVGIQVTENASPTLLNNIVANLETGVSVDGTSGSTVLGGMLYQGNTTNTQGVGLGQFPLVLGPNDPLFVNAAAGNFYLEEFSQAIDSSVDTLPDRNNYVNYISPLGIAVSPILSPDRDVTGQLRVDDPSVAPPAGFGQNVFKDRGALDRVDFGGPTASLITPRDNDANGLDENPADHDVTIGGVPFPKFSIQLADGIDPFEAQAGTGIDDTTVTPNTVTLTKDGVLLVQGIDYIFNYDATNDTIDLVPVAGIWPVGSTYVITLDNTLTDATDTTAIRDIAGNLLKPNRPDLSTTFNIELTSESGTPGGGNNLDYGDAPAPYPTLVTDNGARHVILDGFHLGASNDAEPNGQPTPNADGDGSSDDGVVFVGGTQIFRGRPNSQITVTASQAGRLDAWIDFNRDGDWNDPGEQIFVNQQLTGAAGGQTLSFTIPINAVLGTTFARFRFSSAGGLSPVGLAQDGEVEDYRLEIIANPWQNPNNNLDVSGDGVVSPLDALLIVNRLTIDPVNGSQLGPTRPGNAPFFDVDGDGIVTNLDTITIINYLNSRGTQGEPAGESSAMASSSAVAASEPDAEGEAPAALLAVDSSTGSSLATEQTADEEALPAVLVGPQLPLAGVDPLAPESDTLLGLAGLEDDEDDLFDYLADDSDHRDACDDFFAELGA